MTRVMDGEKVLVDSRMYSMAHAIAKTLVHSSAVFVSSAVSFGLVFPAVLSIIRLYARFSGPMRTSQWAATSAKMAAAAGIAGIGLWIAIATLWNVLDARPHRIVIVRS
eukprot:ANDGO_07925.mRNA.1 hypothetical protein